ncbi:MAG: ATP-binding protein, partial [Myxococcales bacterium]|nr:ATP-binding protein [Myxococcales bacterium]
MSHLWESALSSLRSRLSDENYRTWLEPLQMESFEGSTVTLRIPNRFYADWISSHYLDLILEALTAESGVEGLDVEWTIDESLQKTMDAQAEQARRTEETVRATPTSPPPGPAMDGAAPADTGLNPKYRFDNFIVGPSNQLAHAASVAAASSPGTRYNPLFIYGGVGLGKTHLVNAIGHRIRQEKADARVLFLSAERFTNEFIWALQNHRISEFRQRYRRSCDVLCIDDIQFLAGREQTQEEFF